MVALLPMKAHSERIPGKNFRTLVGKPLFRWVLDTLLEMSEIDEVVINTDARNILAQHECVDSDRVRIRDRRPELCGDFTSMNRIIQDDLGHVSADIYLMTHTTNPLLSAETLGLALATYQANLKDASADSLFGVTRYQSRFYAGDGRPINHDPSDLLRTQDLPIWFEENSSLYVFSAESFEGSGGRIGRCPGFFVVPRVESVDVDDDETWTLAEVIARGREVSL